MADIQFPNPALWKFTLGTVVTWIPSLQKDGQKHQIGHVVGFAQDPNDLPLITVRWQDGERRDVAAGYLRTENDRLPTSYENTVKG